MSLAEVLPCSETCSDITSNIEKSKLSKSAFESRKKSFASLPWASATSLAASDFLLDINNYIPIGCIRLERSNYPISKDVWTVNDTWKSFAHPRDSLLHSNTPSLIASFQEILLSSGSLAPYRGLYSAGWIRLEFKTSTSDLDRGQARLYILPDDSNRRIVQRGDASLRKSLQQLLEILDTSKSVWDGSWTSDTCFETIKSSLDKDHDVSLLHIFNTLPSPAPDPNVCRDPDIRTAMDQILQSEVAGLKTTLYPYQRRTAALMLQREAEPAQLLDPRLREATDQNGKTWYFDLDAAICVREPRKYEAARGAICAETMGLGKTLICLALIMATKELYSQIPPEYSVGTIPVRPKVGTLMDMCGATIGRTGTPWKSYLKAYEDQGYEPTNCYEAIKRGKGYYLIPHPPPQRATRHPVIHPPRKVYLSTTTLVVVPSNLINQWKREIQKHTTGLKVLVLTGQQVIPPAVELAEQDIVLISRQKFDMESKDGSDALGRRGPVGSCHCKYIVNMREQDCTCFNADRVYRSPLREVRFKRMVTDEGHIMGNSSNASKSNVVRVSESLEVESKFILSGTPTQNLYGLDIGIEHEFENSHLSKADDASNLSPRVIEQERKDLEKLGNIATNYLKMRPWANKRGDDEASWSQYVVQPRHGARSHGNMACLRTALEGMIIRHRSEDVMLDIKLPPLHSKVVYLEPSLQDKLSMNLFSLMITSNAVTSERKDEDYLFHSRQRAALSQLVSNLRQSSFFWCGFQANEVQTTIELAQRFLDKGEIIISDSDSRLLREAIEVGKAVLANSTWRIASEFHEVPVYIENSFPSYIRKAWSLDEQETSPSMLGLTQVHALQKFGNPQLKNSELCVGFESAGLSTIDTARAAQATEKKPVYRTKAKVAKIMQQKKDQIVPALAGGVNVGHDTSPRKRIKPSASTTSSSSSQMKMASTEHTGSQTELFETSSNTALHIRHSGNRVALDSHKLLSETKLISTASAKLTYLLDQVLLYHHDEKIIIFYEADNVAFYIAQALECLGIEHLIYAKQLTAERKSSYIVTFNITERFRVILMDISQAAFGLDMSSASRVFFVNPVLNRTQVEAQAIKRAHRIGQTRPVYVETLVLRSSIEEAIIQRRDRMTSDEQKKCKSVLDDRTLYDWIRNVSFVPLPDYEVPAPQRTSFLQSPHPVFGLADVNTYGKKLESQLVLSETSPTTDKGKGKMVEQLHDHDKSVDIGSHAGSSTPAQSHKRKIRFADDMEDLNNDGHMAKKPFLD